MRKENNTTQTKLIQENFCKYLVEKGREHVCENFGYMVGEIDVAHLSESGLLHEYEVKISRSDFLADKEKGKWKFYDARIENYMPNSISYVCPDGLIKKDEIPHYAGLYYWDGNSFSIIRGAKRLHSKPVQNIDKMLRKMLRLTVQRKYMGCAMLTMKNKKAADNYRQINN